jgi:hypothetical protein
MQNIKNCIVPPWFERKNTSNSETSVACPALRILNDPSFC